jgi:hypothetical protein
MVNVAVFPPQLFRLSNTAPVDSSKIERYADAVRFMIDDLA